MLWLEVLANLGYQLGTGATGFQLIQECVGVFDGYLKILVSRFFVAQQVRRESDFGQLPLKPVTPGFQSSYYFQRAMQVLRLAPAMWL